MSNIDTWNIMPKREINFTSKGALTNQRKLLNMLSLKQRLWSQQILTR